MWRYRRTASGAKTTVIAILQAMECHAGVATGPPSNRPRLALASAVTGLTLTQACSQVEPAPHATGVGLDRTPGGVGQAEPLQQLARTPLRLRPGHLQQPPDQQQVLKTRQILIDRRLRWH